MDEKHWPELKKQIQEGIVAQLQSQISVLGGSSIANEVAAEHVKSHEIRFTLQGIFLVVLLGGLGLLAWVVGG